MLSKIKHLSSRLGTRQLVYEYTTLRGKRAALLYDYVKRTDSPTSKGAAAVLGCANNSSIIRKSAEHLEQVLVDNLTMIQPGDLTTEDPSAARRYVWKLIGIGAGQMLNPFSAAVSELLEEAFTIAEKHGLIEAAKTASSFMAMRTATPVLDREKHPYYRDKSAYYESLFLDYQLILINQREIEGKIVKGIQPPEVILLLKQLRAQCLRAEIRHQHPRLTLLLKYITLRIAFEEGDHQEVICVAGDAIKWASSAPFYLRQEADGFQLFLAQAYLLAEDFTNGYPYLERLLESEDIPNKTRQKLLETCCLLSLRTGQYRAAAQSFTRLKENSKNSGTPLPASTQVLRGYLFILHHLGVYQMENYDKYRWLKATSLKKILVDSALLANSSYMIHYQTINLLFHLKNRKFKVAKQAAKTLPAAKRPLSFRYRVFYQLVETGFTQGLHRVAVERHTRALMKKLTHRPVTQMAILGYEEVIPYEVLWTLFLDQLGTKRLKIK